MDLGYQPRREVLDFGLLPIAALLPSLESFIGISQIFDILCPRSAIENGQGKVDAHAFAYLFCDYCSLIAYFPRASHFQTTQHYGGKVLVTQQGAPRGMHAQSTVMFIESLHNFPPGCVPAALELTEYGKCNLALLANLLSVTWCTV